MGTNIIYNMDCLEYMAGLDDNAFDIAIADPPYNLKKTSVRGSGKLKNRVLNTSDMSWDFAPPNEFFEELRRVSKHQIIWGGNYFDLPPCRCFVSWDKMQPWENFSQAEFAWTSFDKPAKVVRMTSRIRNKIHPTQKPIELYTYLLHTFTKEGDRIFDPMFGSGASRIACYKMGFDYVGCEISPEYYKKHEEWYFNECLSQKDLFR